MPQPGQANNGLGINSFSGPLGQQEPAYGAVERASVLSRLAPVGSPAALNAPKRAKRRAVKGKTAAPPQPVSAAAAVPVTATQQPQNTYQQELTEFWSQVASDPEASPEVRSYAAQVA